MFLVKTDSKFVEMKGEIYSIMLLPHQIITF
jgi:hypothetical protein